MKLLLWVLIVLSAVPALATSCAADVPLNQTGTLTIRPVTPDGDDLSAEQVELFQNGRRVNVPLDKIPYGKYQARILVRSFLTTELPVVIDEPYTFSRVQMSLSHICISDRPTLAGLVVGSRPLNLWIKAVPMHGSGMAVEGKVESKGGFSLRGLESGEYIFLLTSGSRIVHQVVQFVDASNKPLQITLPESK